MRKLLAHSTSLLAFGSCHSQWREYLRCHFSRLFQTAYHPNQCDKDHVFVVLQREGQGTTFINHIHTSNSLLWFASWLSLNNNTNNRKWVKSQICQWDNHIDFVGAKGFFLADREFQSGWKKISMLALRSGETLLLRIMLYVFLLVLNRLEILRANILTD